MKIVLTRSPIDKKVHIDAKPDTGEPLDLFLVQKMLIVALNETVNQLTQMREELKGEKHIEVPNALGVKKFGN